MIASSGPAEEKKRLATAFGEVAYLEAGASSAPPVLFIHGIPTSGWLWRHVLGFMKGRFHCVAPDLLGLGDTVPAPGNARYDMDAQAEMLLDLMERLGHREFSVVAHDQGGAAAQILAAHQPDRIRALVLTDCVAYDNWPVPAIAQLQALARLPLLGDALSRTGLQEWVETATPWSRFRRGVFDPAKLSDEAIREYLRPLREGAAGRERFKAFLLAGHSRCTQAAVEGLRRFDKPTLVLWAGDDRYLSPSWGKKLAEEIPGCRGFEIVPFCGHFWPEERPSEFASLIAQFLVTHAGARKEPAAAGEVAA